MVHGVYSFRNPLWEVQIMSVGLTLCRCKLYSNSKMKTKGDEIFNSILGVRALKISINIAIEEAN